MSVADLASDSVLRIRVLAGRNGVNRPITWAHVCELSRPWEWLDTGVLLLTNGLALPCSGADQIEFVESLSGAGLAGMILSKYEPSPVPSEEMLDRANQLDFPILHCDGDVSLSEIIRAVALANRSEEYARLVKTLRLYDGIRFAIARGDTVDFMIAGLASELDCALSIVGSGGGGITAGELPTEEVIEDIREAVLSTEDARVGVLRFADADRQSVALDMGTTRPIYLVASGPPGRLPPLSLLRHAATGVALEFERRDADREREFSRAKEVWKNYLDGRADTYEVAETLRSQGLNPDEGVQVLALNSGGDAAHLTGQLREAGVAVLPADRPPLVSILVRADVDVAAAIDALPSPVALGVSEPHTGMRGLTDAAQEARWALVGAQGRPGVHRYGNHDNPLLPGSVTEARALVRNVLGNALDYDAAHGSELIKSLRVFVVHDRAWQAAADALFVHKQTLVYRLGRVEKLTGRKLSTSAGLAELWIALQALAGLEDLGGRPSEEDRQWRK